MKLPTPDLNDYIQQVPELTEDQPGTVERFPTLVAARDAIFALLPPPPAKLLDIGSACGWAVLQLIQRGYDATALTRMPAEREAMLKNGIPDNRICLADMHRLPPDWTETWDIIRASHVLEHSPAPFIALCEWHRVLKHEGHLQIVIPDRDGYLHLETKQARRLGSMPHHLFMPDAHMLIEMLRHPRIGFRFDGYYEIPQSHDGRVNYWHRVWIATKI